MEKEHVLQSQNILPRPCLDVKRSNKLPFNLKVIALKLFYNEKTTENVKFSFSSFLTLKKVFKTKNKHCSSLNVRQRYPRFNRIDIRYWDKVTNHRA